MMKKSIAFLLILVLLSGAFCPSANSVTQEKITTDLKNALNTMSDEDTVGVQVKLSYMLGGIEAHQTAYDYADRTTGIDRNNFKSNDEKKEYYRVFQIKLNEIKHEQAYAVMENMGVTYDDMICSPYYNQNYYEDNVSILGVPVKYLLTKERVERLTDAEEVVQVSLAPETDDNPYLNPQYSSDPAEKPTAELKELLSTLSDSDKLNVWVSALPNYLSVVEIEEMTDEICGELDRNSTLEEVNAWKKKKNELRLQDRITKVAALMNEFSLTVDDVICDWSGEVKQQYWPYAFSVTKSKLLEMLDHPQILAAEIYIGQDMQNSFTSVVNKEGKITDRLRAKFNVVSDTQKIEVWLSANSFSDDYHIKNSISEEASNQCGYTVSTEKNIIKIVRWYSVYNKLYYTNRHDKVAELVEMLGISEEDVLEEWSLSDLKCTTPKKLLLTKSQIESIASAAMELNDVYYLDLYVGQDMSNVVEVSDWEENPWEGFLGTAYYKGDTDDDFVITVIDATLIQKKLASIVDDPDGVIARNGDVTGDGLDIIDAAQIQKKLAGFENKFDVGGAMIIP